MTFRTVARALTCALLIAAPAAAQKTTTAPAAAPADLAGTWDVMFNTAQGQYPATMTLKKDGDKIAGTISSQIGEAPIEAEAKGSSVTLWFTMQSQQGTLEINMTGTASGDSMKGTAAISGQQGSDWTATRKSTKDAKDTKELVDLSGSWTLTVTLSEMTASPSLTLKQDGDKLTGTYASAQYGEFPVTGTVTGSNFTVTFPMTVEGNAMTVTYTGTIDKDALKGTASYGDMMSGAFTGSRKK